MNHQFRPYNWLIPFIILFFSPILIQAQTPGLIYKPATNGGNKILDRNGDGYVSLTTAGFPGVNMDEGESYSEIPYRPFPVFMNEPLSDLKTGANYGHTDFAPKVYDEAGLPVGSPLASYFDGTNFLFRVRLAGESSASKGYSILIDTDNTLTGVSPNPGFEYEVVLTTNFDVRIYNHKDYPNGGKIIFQGSVDQYSQKSIASSQGGGDPDYFYDFYVPMSAFGGAITSTTPLRMTGTTVTSAKSGIYGVASDIGGVDDRLYNGDIISIWKDIINGFPSTTPTGIQTGDFAPVVAVAPKVHAPLFVGSIKITGSSTEAAGSVITIFQDGTSVGATTVAQDGSWNLTVTSSTLIAGRKITATVKPTNKTVSAASAPVTVEAAPPVLCSTEPPVISSQISNSKGFLISSTSGGTLIIYTVSGNNFTRYYTTTIPANSVNYKVESCTTGNCLPAGTYVATVQPPGGCESGRSNQVCYSGGNQATFVTATAPTITTTALNDKSTVISGTATAGATITITKNGVAIGSTTLGTNVTSWSVSLSGVALYNGDVLYARATVTSDCGTVTSPRSNAATVTVSTAQPTVTGTYCGPTISISGTSTEVAGTIIRVRNASNAEIGSTTVNANGTWTAPISSTSSGTLNVTATAPNKNVSSAASVTINPLYAASSLAITGSATSNTIYEGSTTVKGTGPTGAYITLYINGSPYVDKDGVPVMTVVTNGVWEFTGISPFELYAGNKLTVKAKSAPSAICESAPSAEVTVACNPANTAITATFASPKFCPGTPAVINLNTSEIGIIYNIYNGTTTSGSSVLGTGGPITLKSAPMTIDGTKLTVKTIKIGAPCQYTIGSELTVSLYPPVPNAYSINATYLSGCPNLKTVFTVVGAEAGYSYQLINNDTKENIGPAIVPSSNGDISFPEVTVPKTTTYGVFIKSTVTGCTDVNGTTFTKTVTITGPNVYQVVTIDNARLCTTGTNSTTIRVTTENNSNYTYKLYDSSNPSTPIATFVGDGSVVATTVGPFTTVQSKTYYVDVQVAGTGGCLTRLATETNLEVTDGIPATVSAGSDQTICGNTVTLQGSDPAPGTGKWTRAPGTTGGTITDENNRSTTVSDLTSGTYTFVWTVTSSCGTTSFSGSDSVTITVNCPAVGTVGTNKFVSEYEVGDVLAVISDDSDGGIPSAASYSQKSGTLPPGTTFSLVDNRLVLSVTKTTELVAGNYLFSMRTTDARGMTSEVPLIVRMYSSSYAPSPVTPLPVELVYFSATMQHNIVTLKWLTASEKDNKAFVVERSTDGKVFEDIGTVRGNGNSSLPIKYSFSDAKLLKGTAYYRLKQIDVNGTFTYSKVIAVTAKGIADNLQLQVYPNPFSSELNVVVTALVKGTALLQLVNMQGKVLFTEHVPLQPGLNELMLPLRNLTKGMYILRLNGNGINGTVKVLKN